MYEKKFPSYVRIAGIDEVGVGSLVGDIFSAAVILNPAYPIYGLRDSKKISAKKRLLLCNKIVTSAFSWSIGRVSRREIDKFALVNAIKLSMIRAIEGLTVSPTFIYVDGIISINTLVPCMSIVKGDDIIPEISAASIIAKVFRDEYMLTLDRMFPKYGFSKNKGYGTKKHLYALKKYGFTCFHRKTYKIKSI